MLEQDDMHAASDHEKRPTTRVKAVCLLEERKEVWRSACETTVTTRLDADGKDARG
jgi:hypothetical protein